LLAGVTAREHATIDVIGISLAAGLLNLLKQGTYNGDQISLKLRTNAHQSARQHMPNSIQSSVTSPHSPEPQDLRAAGLKATLPRLKVLEVFQNSNKRHLTAEDVYRVLLNEESDVGLATIYRVLDQFEKAGVLARHHFEGGKAIYELEEGKHHDHIVCLQCGRVEEFYDAEIEKRQIKVAKERGFAIHEHQLYIYADCTKEKCEYRNRK
jgi:Fur family transcriptional regulator, ferric uptake regulator